MKEIISQVFKNKFGSPEISVFAPGRANIIGEHTDYNEGLVLPFAISQGVWFFGKSNDKGVFNISAYDTGEESVISLGNDRITYGWEKYFRQVLQTMNQYPMGGADIVFGGNLPIGAGISSSSAITCGFIAILNHLYALSISTDDMVLKARIAETGYGVRGGIMDQYTIFNGKKDKAILIDCRTNSHEYVDIDLEDHHFYLINTNVKHNLIHTDYNNRRAECEKACELLSQHYRPISALRDLEVKELPDIRSLLDDVLFNRVSFVVQENNRVLMAILAIRQKNYARLGELLYESHDGLSQMYHVSCDELDWLVNYTLDLDAFAGARMMGGGFGGCTINLTHGELGKDIITDIQQKYLTAFGIRPDIIPVSCEDGIVNKKLTF